MADEPEQAAAGDKPSTSWEPSPVHRSGGLLRPLAAVGIALLLGGGVGAALHAALSDDDRPEARRSPTTASPSPDMRPSPSPGLVTGPAAPCLQAADLASQALQTIRGAATAVGSLDAARLQAALDEVERLQPLIQAQARECRQLFLRPTPTPTS